MNWTIDHDRHPTKGYGVIVVGNREVVRGEIEYLETIVRAVNTFDEAKVALHAAYEELNQKVVDRACRAETIAMVKQSLAKMEGRT